MSKPEERREILITEMRGLEQYLSGLSTEAWEYPTACSEWCIADVVAHITRNNQNYASRVLRALQGDESPDELSPRRGHGEVDPAGGARRVIDFRREAGAPDAMLGLLAASNLKFRETLLTIGSMDWDKIFYRPSGSEPVRNIVDIMLAEQVIHGWDIRSRFDREATLTAAAVPILVERVPQRPRWWSFQFDPDLSPLPLRYRFEITTPLQYRVDAVVTESQQFTEVGSEEPAQVTFRCDGETFIMLMYGRLKAADALAEGRLPFEGANSLAAEFVQRFTGG